jgi:hypothetical protein
MDEYISREELRKHLKECYDDELFDADMKKAVIGIDIYVENMPSADVQPVKHGKWIEKKVCRMKWIPYADDDVNPDDVDIECMTEQKCSYCKRWTIKFTYHIELDYCPLCGARMDGDSE